MFKIKINKLRIINYKIFRDEIINLHENCNIFVGDNDSGKSTLLEALQIVLSNKLNSYSFERQIKASFFNQSTRRKYIESIKSQTLNEYELPKITIEAYFSNINAFSAELKGSNNTLCEDCPGISIELSFNDQYSREYKKMLCKGEIDDIPIEFYSVNWYYFSGNPVVYRSFPVRLLVIDTTRKKYSNTVSRFIYDNISDSLTDDEKTNLCAAYRKMKKSFLDNDSVKTLNKCIENRGIIKDRKITFGVKEDTLDAWKDEVSIDVEDIPFENIGFGTQKFIKMELALQENSEESSIILFEEPENNLSYGNMSRLISKISKDLSKQVFISTHSSYVANKLGLDKISILHNGKVEQLRNIKPETMEFFKKLPGYNTLRLLLTRKCILVEGPTEELIVQRAYLDKFGKVPIADSVDIIAVNSLAFKRYCEIAILVEKPIVIVTDNDGDIDNNILRKYKDLIENNSDIISLCYENNEELNTLELSVLEANSTSQEDFQRFTQVISKIGKNKEEVLSFMLSNKTEWALRVFNSEDSILYPGYIKDAIQE